MTPELHPGDLLLFDRRGSVVNWWIRVKTWSDVSHCEVYVGDGWTWASRNGEGVNEYPVDTSGLRRVLRPDAELDWPAGREWFVTVRGQGYDYLGLLAFYYARWQGRESPRMFCSEFATRLYRALGLEPFRADTDADGVAPSSFDYSPRFAVTWRA
ncbi:MAG TPA: hypothetical protein DCP69_10025 [Candidatus Omnitrophica bacterium]|nr:hypothetical protein [Candidatus Omnitrophota bacterium]